VTNTQAWILVVEVGIVALGTLLRMINRPG
jgi:hypothetical protein